MAGNIWQWTSSIYKSYPYKPDDGRERDTDSVRVKRGGSGWVPAFGATWLCQRDRHRQFSLRPPLTISGYYPWPSE